MRNLSEFNVHVPNDNEIALCEINGRVHYMNAEYANVGAFTTSTASHPKIHITRDQLHSTTSGDEGKALFLPVDVSFLKQLTQVYYEQGPVEALHLAKSHHQFVVSRAATLLLGVMKYVQKFRLILNPNIRYSGPTLISQLGQTRDWKNSTIRFVAWHPNCTKIALVTCDDGVRIFSSDSNYSPLLRCKQQRNITCVAWRPLSHTEIAVAHEDGIIIWNIDPNSLVSRPSVSNAIILQRIEHRPVMSIAWSPNGDRLVSVAACDRKILVWDPELDRTSSLKRPGGFGQVLVKWSPTGDKIFTCTDGIVFRVWDYRNWECERWTVPSGRVQSACWSNCGTTLLFATNVDTMIYGVIVKSGTVFANNADSSSNQALPIFDVSKRDLEGVMVGGLVQCMETDPKGKHLAIMFKDTSTIAVFGIIRQPTLRLIPGSLIMGLAEEKPSSISFQQNFTEGACLTIGWSSGRIQYFPIIYTDAISEHIIRSNS
ncbi:aladin-like [Anthonomus grandis grandis]|uniref:aladin-like n=1 Tax=Anthonomus grandis grandis TaxID=2921223 RepID=UPI0021665E79|nr:aladin-like [Anthonomus grandis grandis]